jgi:hypothetical protein
LHLVEVLVPLYDNEGRRFAAAELERIRRELTDAFGGVTAHTRAPAEGAWEDDRGRVHHDDVIVVEVMVGELDRAWWASYRDELAKRLRQDTLLVRATGVDVL